MNEIDEIVNYLKERRDKVLKGEINCIPLPFNRFRSEFPGIEQGMYYLVSGMTKAGKTQITNYLFVYNTIIYAYNHPGIIKPKIFYYNLEETDTAITLRFMAFLLYSLYKIRISPTDLKSTDSQNPLSLDILAKIESPEYQKILKFFKSCIEFKESRNPTGVWKDMHGYAKSHGKTITEPYKFMDDFGNEQIGQKFSKYIPDTPNEYVIIIIDHVSLLESERGMDLRQCINKLSEYLIVLRNKYRYIPVVVQQQNIETMGLEAYKANKIRPTIAGLADSKNTGKDASMMIGITNPFSFEFAEYLGYNIKKLRDTFRCLEIVVNREGKSNGVCPLYFDGAVNYYAELPKPNDVGALNKVYDLVTSNTEPKKEISLFTYCVNKLKNKNK